MTIQEAIYLLRNTAWLAPSLEPIDEAIEMACDALDKVEYINSQLGKADRKTENSSEKPNNCTDCGCTDDCTECKEAEHGCKDEPQTDCAWKKPEEFNCKECRWWSPITKTCHCDEFPCKYEPIPII